MSQSRPTSGERTSRPTSRTRLPYRLPSSSSIRISCAPSTKPLKRCPRLLTESAEVTLIIIEQLLADDPNPGRTAVDLMCVCKQIQDLINGRAVSLIGSFAAHRASEWSTVIHSQQYRDVGFWDSFKRWTNQKGVFKNATMSARYTNLFVSAYLEANSAWDVTLETQADLRLFVVTLMSLHLQTHVVQVGPHSAVLLNLLANRYNDLAHRGFPTWTWIYPTVNYECIVRHSQTYLGSGEEHPHHVRSAQLHLLTSIKEGGTVLDPGYRPQLESIVRTAFKLPLLSPGFAYRSHRSSANQTLVTTASDLTEWQRLQNSREHQCGALEAQRPNFKVAATVQALHELTIF